MADELESILIRLIGDKSDFERIMAEAEQDIDKAAEDIKKHVQEVEREQRRMLADAARLVEATLTPIEQFNQELGRYKELLAAGAISQDVYNRAVKQLNEQIPDVRAEQDRLNAELREAEAITRAVMSPLEIYNQKLDILEKHLKDGRITQETYNRAVDEMKRNLPEARKALEDAARAEQEARKVQEYLNAELREAEQITRSLMTPTEKYAEKIGILNAHLNAGRLSIDTYIRAVESMQKELPEAKAALDAARVAQDAMNREIEEGKRLVEAMLLPEQRYEKELANLSRLLKAGRIDQDTYNRAVDKARSQLPAVIAALQAEEKAIDDMNNSLKEAYNVQRSLMGPAEQYREKLTQLNKLHRQGYVDGQTYAKGLKHLRAEFSTIRQNAMQVGQAMQSMGGHIKNAGRLLTFGLTAPISAFAAGSVKAFSDFDNAMTEGFAIMGDLSEDMKRQLKEVALGFDRSKFGPEQLADGLKNLAAAGLTAEQSMGALPVVEKFATAGAFDLARATQLLTDSQSALGMVSKDHIENMKNMIAVSDALVKAGDQSTASPEQFAEALANGAADAKNFGMELETTMAVLDAYASKGNKGAAAGSDLARATRLIAKATRENGEVFQKFGIDVIDDATGEYKNLIDIIADMENAFDGMTGPQRSAALELMGFEALAQSAILPLIGMSDQMKIWEEQQRSAMGYTEKVALKQMESFKNSMMALWNNIKKVGIEIGAHLAPAIKWVGGLVESSLKWWQGLSEEAKTATLVIAGLAAGLGPFLVMVGTGVGVVGALVTGIAAIAAVGAPAIATVAAIAGGVAWVALEVGVATAALAGLVYYIVGPEGLSYAWQVASEYTQAFVKNTAGFLANFQHNWKALMKWLPDNWQYVVMDMVSLWFGFNKALGMGIETGLRIASRLFVAFQGWLQGMFNQMFTVDFIEAVLGGVEKVGQIFAHLGTHIWDTIKGSMVGKKADTKGFMAKLFKDFDTGAKFKTNFFEQARDIIKEEAGSLENPFKDFKSSIKELPDFVFETTKEAGKAVGAGMEAGLGTANEASKETKKVAKDITTLFDEESDKQRKSIDAMMSKLKEQEATYGMSKYQVEVYRLAQAGATEEELKAARAMADKLDLQEQQKDELKEAERIMKKHAAAQEELTRQAKKYQTPAEKFANIQKELDELLGKGLISMAAYQTEIEEARKAMQKDIKVNFKVTGVEAVESGTAEARNQLEQFLALRPDLVDVPMIQNPEQMLGMPAPVAAPNLGFSDEAEQLRHLDEGIRREFENVTATMVAPAGQAVVEAVNAAEGKTQRVERDERMLQVLETIAKNTESRSGQRSITIKPAALAMGGSVSGTA